VQTFLPYPNFKESALVLDRARLGKQRVEANQILNAIKDPHNGWRHHPAVKMWRGYENALCLYRNTMIQEWIRRGYVNNMPLLFFDAVQNPWWLGLEEFHASHRSNLLRKDPKFYGQYGWLEPSDLPYFWPCR